MKSKATLIFNGAMIEVMKLQPTISTEHAHNYVIGKMSALLAGLVDGDDSILAIEQAEIWIEIGKKAEA